MDRRTLWILAGIVVVLLVLSTTVLLQPRTGEPLGDADERGRDLAQALGDADTDGYARADRRRRFQFPADHGAHPDYRNEWWYFTGNLQSETGRHFGYELALFRIALSPDERDSPSDWATRQVYMGHFAVTDTQSRRFHFFERFARDGAGLAGARAEPLRVWLEDWSVTRPPSDDSPWRLQAAQGDVQVDLRLDPVKPVVLQGEQGLSRKSSTPGNASYYYSLTRMRTTGSIRVGATEVQVNGLSWMDREWSTSALGAHQKGWDWFAIQLNDGYDLMFYQLRQRDGEPDPHSQGVLVAPDGTVSSLDLQDVNLKVLERWESPRGGSYPARWHLEVPGAQLRLDIVPHLPHQELAVSVRYWEGAVRVQGRHKGQAVTGNGYVELTGYAPSQGESASNP